MVPHRSRPQGLGWPEPSAGFEGSVVCPSRGKRRRSFPAGLTTSRPSAGGSSSPSLSASRSSRSALRLATTVASLMVAIIVAATLAPFAVRMHARGWSSLKAAGALTGALVLGVLAVVVIVILALVPVLTDVGTSISDAVTRLEAILVALPFGDAIEKLLDVLIGLARERDRWRGRDDRRFGRDDRDHRDARDLHHVLPPPRRRQGVAREHAWDDGLEPRAHHAGRPGCGAIHRRIPARHSRHGDRQVGRGIRAAAAARRPLPGPTRGPRLLRRLRAVRRSLRDRRRSLSSPRSAPRAAQGGP